MMHRTQNRPLPKGRVTVKQATCFAMVLGISGILILAFFVNRLTALLTFLSLLGYAGLYTVYLKRATPQNIVIGGIAGAAPPLLGWVAVTDHLDPQALLLVLIIFVWTPPHFWALALHRFDEYKKADIPMLPVTHGIDFTKLCIWLYTLLLVPITLLPFVINMSGLSYAISSLLLNAGFLYWSSLLLFVPYEQVIQRGIAQKTFRYSIVYLMLLFVALLVDHAL